MINQDSAFDELVSEQINRTLKKGSLTTSLLGYTSSFLLFIAEQFGVARHLNIPILWTLTGGTYALLIYLLARKRKITGSITYMVMWGLVSIPTTIFVFAHISLPSGVATYVNGPAGYLYFFLIAVTGFTFNFRLSLIAGVLASAQYLIVILLSESEIRNIKHHDFLMQQDNSEIMFYLFRPLMMALTGFVTGVIGRHVRNLISETVLKEKEKDHINRLFGLYVSPEIREKVTKAKTDSAGEKKNLSILFCDIRNFTTMSEAKPPEELVSELNEYFNAMAEAIAFEGGTIDKFIGDAVMAIFGGAVELENPGQNALNAALHMRRNLHKLNEKRSVLGFSPLENGIGLHHGEVFIGSIGSSERKDYTVIGDAVNTASRIESLCKEYGKSLLFSGDFLKQLPPDIQTHAKFIENVKVKGKKEAVPIYTIN